MSWLTKMKGMSFDHDFVYSFSLFSSLLKKREEEKENELAKNVIKSHAFQPGRHSFTVLQNLGFKLDL